MEAYEQGTKTLSKHDMRPMQESDISQEVADTKTEGEVLQSGLSEQGTHDEGQEAVAMLQFSEGGEKSSVERGTDLQKTQGQLQGGDISEMPTGVSTDGEERRIHNATQTGDGSTSQPTTDESGSGTSHRPQSKEQSDREPCAFCKQWGTQATRTLGIGTALKPAHEPICMARKPLSEKTVAENVLKYGTGGINIDESRVGTDGGTAKGTFPNEDSNGIYGNGLNGACEIKDIGMGRFPANLIHDNSEEVRECFPESSGRYGAVNTGNVKFSPADYGTGQKDSGGTKDSGNASRFFKSIMTDSLCTLCCLPFDIKHDTMSVCNNTNVNNAEKSSEATQATTEVTAPRNATTPDSKKFVQSVRSVANLCDLCGTYIALVLAGGKPVRQEEEARGQIFITKHKKQILDNALASFVELRGKKDTTPTINNLNLLFGYVFNAIENSTIYYEQEKEEGKIHEWKSLLYQAKASKSDRGDGNNHPTVKPVALMEYLITMTSRDGATILDPFMGSGTTGVACKNLNRNFIGIEMDEAYFDIAKGRIDNA